MVPLSSWVTLPLVLGVSSHLANFVPTDAVTKTTAIQSDNFLVNLDQANTIVKLNFNLVTNRQNFFIIVHEKYIC